MMTHEEILEALFKADAERAAAALEAISRLSETKLSVAVFSGGKAA